MKNALLWFGLVVFSLAVSAKSEYFSDVPEEEYKKLREIARYLRHRIETAEESPGGEPGPEPRTQSPENEIDPPFVYAPPKVRPKVEDSEPFAVGPSDPRFYGDFGTSAKFSEPAPERKEKRPETQRAAVTGELGDEVPGPSYNKYATHSAVRQIPVTTAYDEDGKADIYFTAIVAGCSAAAVVAVIAVGIGCYRLGGWRGQSVRAGEELKCPLCSEKDDEWHVAGRCRVTLEARTDLSLKVEKWDLKHRLKIKDAESL